MKPDAVRFFVCPGCHGELQIRNGVAASPRHPPVGQSPTGPPPGDSREIAAGELRCRGCAAIYPIVRGVPRFVSAEGYAASFGRQWLRWATTQQDRLNGTTIFKRRLERYTGWRPEDLDGAVVVDAGCGAGAFIDVVEDHAAAVVGFDLSAAVDAAYRLHGGHPRVHIAQGDIFQPPVRPGVADKLYTFGVVQHTPDPERAFRSLIPLVRDGGAIAVWVYRRRWLPQPQLLLRPLTRRLEEPAATRFIEWYVPKAMRLSGALAQAPLVGKWLRRLVPVADYRGRLELSDEQIHEWAVMDTHDMLITRYTFPQRWRDLERWMSGLTDVCRPTAGEMAAVGVKRHSSSVYSAW